MFTLLDSDPRASYHDTLKRMTQALEGEEPAPPMTLNIMKYGRLAAAWDSVFRDVPGNRMAIVYQNAGREAGQRVGAGAESREATGTSGVYDVMIGGTEPAGTKWLVTRATTCQGKPVCWCKPVEVEKGKTKDIRLTAGDMINLETI
jgi:hypothetical protein